MFDRIFVEAKLPIPSPVDKLKINWKKEEFQTKDFENMMYNYRVNRAGQLLFLDQNLEWVHDGTRFGGHMNVISERWTKSSYTGNVVFYTTVCSDLQQKECNWMESVTQEKIDSSDGFDYSLDFKAKFVDGKLINIELLKVDAYPIKEYLINHNKWVETIKEKEAKISYKIKSLLKRYIPFNGYHKIVKNLNKFVSFQQKLINKLY
jgi:hypothetical protein